MSQLEVNLNDAIGTMVNNNTVVVDGEIICRVSEDSTLEKTRPRQYHLNQIVPDKDPYGKNTKGSS